MSRHCSHCGLFSPNEALRCDCGYDFETRTLKQSYLAAHVLRKRADARESTGGSRWVLWASASFLAATVVTSAASCVATDRWPSPGMAPIALLFLSVALRHHRIVDGQASRQLSDSDDPQHESMDQPGDSGTSVAFVAPRTLSIVTAEVCGQGPTDFVTWLPAQWQATNILSPEHILGRLVRPRREGGTLHPENFVQHEAFVQFLHEFLARELPGRAGLRIAACRQKDGWVSFVDMRVLDAPRNRRQRDPLPEDVVGSFRVRDGSIVPGSYRRNSAHRLLSAKGMFRLEYAVQERLKQEIAARHAFRGAGQPASELVM